MTDKKVSLIKKKKKWKAEVNKDFTLCFDGLYEQKK